MDFNIESETLKFDKIITINPQSWDLVKPFQILSYFLIHNDPDLHTYCTSNLDLYPFYLN